MQMSQYGVCVRAYPVVCVRGLVCRIRVRTIVREGNIIPYIKDEAIRNYELIRTLHQGRSGTS